MLELLDLTHKRDDYVNGLSRGMKQRLCLAKTLVHDPPVLILDEPASGLDPRARLEVKALLKELRRMGKTILISSHILTELADCCTSIGIIERGQLLMHGPIDEGLSPDSAATGIIEVRFAGDMDSGRQLDSQRPARPQRAGRQPRAAWSNWPATTTTCTGCCSNSPTPDVGLRLLRRQGTDARRRVHDGHQGVGDVAARLRAVSCKRWTCSRTVETCPPARSTNRLAWF